jgi:hypothetical protein
MRSHVGRGVFQTFMAASAALALVSGIVVALIAAGRALSSAARQDGQRTYATVTDATCGVGVELTLDEKRPVASAAP